MTHRSSPALAGTVVIGLLLFGGPVSTFSVEAGEPGGYLSISELEGTIWVAKEPHRRVTISKEGDLQTKEGKNLYLRFLRKVDDILVIEIRWWNASATQRPPAFE